MPRRKVAKNIELKPWLSGNRDSRDGRFIQIGNSLLLSKTFNKLSGNAIKTYFALCMESGGKPTASLSRASAEKKYGINEATFERSIKALIAAGFIACDFDDNPHKFKANVYRFQMGWKQ